MGKRKRKKSGKGGGFGMVGAFIGEGLRFLLKILPATVLCFSLGALFFGVRQALYADSYLVIQKIVVEPSDALSSKEREMIDSQWIGKNILTADLQMVAKQLEKDPKIQIARVTRHLPSALKIEIETRKPVAFVQLAPHSVFGLVSEDGMVLDITKERNSSLILVEAYGANQKALQLGEKLHQKGFVESMKFLKKFWDHPLARYETVSKITLDHIGGVNILLGAGPELRLGRRPLERFAAIERVIPLLEGEGRSKIDYVDLQFDNVIVKRKSK